MLVKNLPRESSLARRLHGEIVDWGLSEHLLALAVDVLQIGNWQRGGGKGSKPRRIPRPGLDDHKVERITGASYSIDELDQILAERRESDDERR